MSLKERFEKILKTSSRKIEIKDVDPFLLSKLAEKEFQVKNRVKKATKKIQVFSEEGSARNSDIRIKSYAISKMRVGLLQQEYQNEKDIIGGNFTHLAIKNTTSYMIGTSKKGIKLIENGKILYSGKLDEDKHKNINDIVYAKHLDCYILLHGHKIYKKGIDSMYLSLLKEVKCGSLLSASMRYSEVNQRLIVAKNKLNISAIDLETGEIDFEVRKSDGNTITSFEVFGKREDRVLALSRSGCLLLYQLNFEQKKGSVINHHYEELRQDRNEAGISLAVCPKNQHVLVEIGHSMDSMSCSKVLLFKLEKTKIVFKASIDQRQQGLQTKIALSCYGYFKRHVLWVGLSMGENGVAQVYDYNLETGEFEELVQKRRKHYEKHPLMLHQFGKIFYYTGNFGRVMKLSLS